MSAFFKKHDIWMRLLSIVLAIALWATVMGMVNPIKDKPFRDLNITFSGQGDLLDNYDLSIIEGADTKVTVRVSGPNNTVAGLQSSRVMIMADLSTVREAGEYDLPLNVTLPAYSDLEVVSVSPSTVHIRVDQVTEKSVPVRVSVTGVPANGYRVGEATTTTKNIDIYGPAGELQEVSYALVAVQADGATGTVQADSAVTLYNEAGEVVVSNHVTSGTETVHVSLAVFKNGTIPLTVRLVDGDTITADMASVTISPESVEVYGDQNTIASLAEIDLGEIDLPSVETDVAVTRPIRLPTGVSLADGQPTSAKITVSIEGVETSDVLVTDLNLAVQPEQNDYDVRLVTESVKTQVRGTPKELEQMEAAVFSVSVPVDVETLGVGTHTIKGQVVVTGLPNGVVLLTDEAEVQVVITVKDPEAPAPEEENTTATEIGAE